MPETSRQVTPADLARDFDQWRRFYDDLTFEDQKAVYREVAELYPRQRAFNTAEAIVFMETHAPVHVMELGGWDGKLASILLDLYDWVESWTNYDLVTVPWACHDARYHQEELLRPFWETPHPVADAFVATHVIEHMRYHELGALVRAIEKIPAVLIEAPIQRKPTIWHGYHGTHILEVGWNAVDQLFRRHGYNIEHEWHTREVVRPMNPHRPMKMGGRSRAVLLAISVLVVLVIAVVITSVADAAPPRPMPDAHPSHCKTLKTRKARKRCRAKTVPAPIVYDVTWRVEVDPGDGTPPYVTYVEATCTIPVRGPETCDITFTW